MPDVQVGGVDAPFDYIADVAGLPAGAFAVLDRRARQIVVFHRDGSIARRFGREGDGPGELKDPTALASVAGRFVIRDIRAASRQPLLFFDTLGQYIGWAGGRVSGDWDANLKRPVVFRITDGPFLMPAEDLTRRLMTLSNGQVAYVVQPPLRIEEPRPIPHPTAYLVRFNIATDKADTLAADEAPTDYPGTALAGGGPIEQDWYVSRPLWAAGGGWIAQAHGDSLTVSVRDRDNRTVASVHLQPSGLITDADKDEFVKWYYGEFVMKNATADMRELYQNTDTRKLRQYSEQIKKAMRWATRAPNVTALYGDGDWLWIGGFAPGDYATGTALTWLAVNVRNGTTAAYRIPRLGARVRDIYDGFLTSYTDDDGVDWLERYNTNCR